MNCCISVCSAALILFIGLDFYLLNNRWDQSWLILPCHDYTCNFNDLNTIYSAHKVAKLETYWDLKLEDSSLNVSELYYCGEYAPVIQFNRCSMKGYYITLVFVNVFIVLIMIKIFLITRNERLRRNDNPPEYTLLPPWA